MIPSWVTNTLVLLAGCVFAILLGSTLPQYDMLGAYLVGTAIVCTFCVVFNNFPLLLAFAIWFPFAAPIPVIRIFPTIGLVMMYIVVVLFFQACVRKKIDYVRSFNVLIVICFAWVPIRFALNPIHKLGGSVAGGHGVSGVNAYFLYALAGFIVLVVGAVLNTRERVMQYMMWSLRSCFIFGTGLLICAFIPVTWPWLLAMGTFAAGNMSEGVLRLVALPGYGLVLMTTTFCPALFRLKWYHSGILRALGMAMLIIGGNRSSMVALLLFMPLVLLLRRKYISLGLVVAGFVGGIALMHATIDQMNAEDVPVYARSLGVFDQKIAKATGGAGSEEWRYQVWLNGWEKIKESPVIGKGFGNLDKHEMIDPNNPNPGADFELVLAAGLAHNGFISAAFGFGLPFAVGITLVLLVRMCWHGIMAWRINNADLELRDFHAFMAGSFATFFVLIYSAFDLSVAYFWIYVGMGIVMDQITRSQVRAFVPALAATKEPPMPTPVPDVSMPKV